MFRLLPLALLLAACHSSGSTTAESLADYERLLDEVDGVVSAHESDMAVVASVDEVPALEASYQADFDAFHEGMHEHMTMMMDCTFTDEGMAMMDEADLTLVDMEEAVMGHMAEHDTHADIGECGLVESAHAELMAMDIEAMRSHVDPWSSGGMDCGGMDMAM